MCRELSFFHETIYIVQCILKAIDSEFVDPRIVNILFGDVPFSLIFFYFLFLLLFYLLSPFPSNHCLPLLLCQNFPLFNPHPHPAAPNPATLLNSLPHPICFCSDHYLDQNAFHSSFVSSSSFWVTGHDPV